MASPLVVFVPSEERDALCNGGVIPSAWFRDVGTSGWDDDEACVRLWTKKPARIDDVDGGVPPHPAVLLGLETAGASSLANEDLAAKFFGSSILHVVFLEEEDKEESEPGKKEQGGGGAGTPAGWVGVEPILETARWAKAFNQSVEYWFSEEQARNIRHSVLVIATGGRVRLSEKRLQALRTELRDGFLKTCYFLDFRLEVEDENDALHARCLWPVLAGRLLLRLLIAHASDGNDDVLQPGIHLWRSSEFLFDYPVAEMSGMLTRALDEAYARLCAETDAAASGDPAKTGPTMRNEDAKPFPGLATALTEFGCNPAPRVVDWRESLFAALAFWRKRKNAKEPGGNIDWHVYPAVAEAKDRTDDDERRWGGRLAKAQAGFAAMETALFREGYPEMGSFSPSHVFPFVASDPRNVAVQRRSVDAENPGDTTSEAEVYRKWKEVIAAEKRRQEAKVKLRRAADELSLAQAHYVTSPYGMLVAVAVSMLCGCSLFRALWSLGGNGALPVAMWFSALSATGAFVAWGIVSFLHRRAGREAADRFADLADDVDEKMDARHGAAVSTVRAAEARHRRTLRFDAWFALHRLLDRVWRILSRELQSPTLSAFYRTTDDGDAEDAPDAAETETRRQRGVYLERTQFRESLGANSFAPGRRTHSDAVLSEMLEQTGPDSFHAYWKRTCDSVDARHLGNLPAHVLVPAIRDWLGDLCDRLSAAQKTDLLEARGADGEPLLPAGFEQIRQDDGYALASAHVDAPHVDMGRSSEQVFVFDETSGVRGMKATIGVLNRARTLIAGAFDNIPVIATSVLNGLPQVAFYFQDIRLFGFGRENDDRLKFLSRREAENVDKEGSR